MRFLKWNRLTIRRWILFRSIRTVLPHFMEVFQLRPSGAQCLPHVSYGIRVTCLVSCVRSKQDLAIVFRRVADAD